MKYFNKLVITVATLGLVFTSCSDMLEVDRVGTITPDEMWNNEEFVNYYVNGFYKSLPAWNQNSNYTEEAGKMTTFVRGINTIDDGYPERQWNYSNIRSINEFFNEIKNSTVVFEGKEKDYLIGQAHFFRAFNYFQMVKTMGGVPIIENVLDPTADVETLQYPRSSTEECFNYIEKELDEAIKLLPENGTVNYASSRITKAAAMAYKADVLLWKASPLFCTSKNEIFWNDAYTALIAAKAELDKEGYGLYDDGTAKTTETIWYNKVDAKKEYVLYIEYKDPEKNNSHQQSQRPLTESSGAAGANQPSWEFVQAYPMVDGTNASESSLYDEKMFWKNRDPRFYTTIVYHGSPYGFAEDTKRNQWIFEGLPNDGYNTWNFTGFYSRKYIDTTLNINNWSHQALDWPIIRYTEVLFNIAEAANEVGKSNEAFDILATIRKRAKIQAGETNRYGLKTEVGIDYNATLKAILDEKLIEMAYEGKRFNDLRRRRLFDIINDYETYHAYAPFENRQNLIDLNIGITEETDINGVVNVLDEAFTGGKLPKSKDEIIALSADFKKELLDKNPGIVIDLPERNYFAPLDLDWIKKNPKLEQNKGWENGKFNQTIQ